MAEIKKSAELIAQEELLKDKDPLKLKDEVSNVYTVADGHVRVFLDTGTGKTVDLNKVGLKEAEDLAKRLGVFVKKVS
jgi:hypothetical protein